MTHRMRAWPFPPLVAGLVLALLAPAAAAAAREGGSGDGGGGRRVLPERAPARGDVRFSAGADLVSLDLVEADLVDVLRYFATVSGVNLVVDPEVKGTVTLRLIDVPWEQALRMMLAAHGLGYQLDGNILWVASMAKLIARAEAEAELAKARRQTGKLRTVVIRIAHADASQVAAIVQKLALSERGSVTVDPRTNSLIITDIEEALPRARSVAAGADRP